MNIANRTYLKVKIKSLAEEARIIRHQERSFKARARAAKKTETKQALYGTFWGLKGHRIVDVRNEQRSTLLAYGFIRGRRYSQLEQKCERKPNWKRVKEIVAKYGDSSKFTVNKMWHEAVDHNIDAWAKGN